MHFAEQGILAKAEMAELLRSARQGATFLARAAEVEKGFHACVRCARRLCLASGCALEGESCLNAILNAGPEYNKACGRQWVALYSNPANRGKA